MVAVPRGTATRGAVKRWWAKLLFQSDVPAGRAAQAAANGDVLRVGGPRELPAITSAAFVGQRSDQRICGCHINRQRCTAVAACGLHAQFVIPCRVLCQLNRYRVGRDGRRSSGGRK